MSDRRTGHFIFDLGSQETEGMFTWSGVAWQLGKTRLDERITSGSQKKSTEKFRFETQGSVFKEYMCSSHTGPKRAEPCPHTWFHPLACVRTLILSAIVQEFLLQRL